MDDEDMIAWIDNASTIELLKHWRFAAPGDPYFMGEVGRHYKKVIDERREADPAAWSEASKSVGWSR